MSRKIEEAFNDCFERLMSGESLDSCISSYPEYAGELDIMLRTAFDVKRKAYPVQPRPEFKYWARVRLQGVQSYLDRQPAPSQPFFSGLRANLAIALGSFIVIVIVSSSTAFASSSAMPDQPLYGVKLAVEQSQLALTSSDSDKAELYAKLVEKRAEEIAVMADQGKTEKVDSTTAIMNYQLDQAATFLQRYEAAVAEASSSTLPAAAAGTTTPSPITPPSPPQTQETTQTTPSGTAATTSTTQPSTTSGTTATATSGTTSSTTTATPTTAAGGAPATTQASGTSETGSTTSSATGSTATAPTTTTATTTTSNVAETGSSAGTTTADNKTGQVPPVKPVLSAQREAELNRIKASINASTSKSVTVLQNALDKAPSNTKSSLNDAIDRAKSANQRFQQQQQQQNTTTNKSTIRIQTK